MKKYFLFSALAIIVAISFCATAQSWAEKIFLTEEEYFNLPEDRLDIAEAALVIIKGYKPDLDVQKYLNRIDSIVAEIKGELKGENDPQKVITAINNYFYGKLKISYDSHLPFLSDILDRDKGNCVASSTLYLAVAQRLGLKVYGVHAPLHIFVKYDDGKTIMNIETTAQGKIKPDSTYIDMETPEEGQMHISQVSLSKGVYLRNLSKKEVLADILGWRGTKYGDNEQYPLSRRDYQATFLLNPNDPLTHSKMSIVYSEIGDYDKAIAECDRASELDPELGLVYAARARLLLKKGDTQRALPEINEALKRKPKMLEGYRTRASIWLKLKEPGKAFDDYTKVLELDPKNMRTLRDRAKLSVDKKDYDMAIADLTKAIEEDPQEYFIYVERGMVWNKKKEPDKAIADFNRTLELRPWEISANHYRGWAWIDKGEYDKAIEDFKAAKGKMPFDIPENCYGRGVAYFKKKDYDSAIREFDDAARNLKDAGLYFYRGQAFMAKNELAKATADFEMAISLDPEMKNEVEPYLKKARGGK